ncbi:FAD/NAD(P)-binding domain-containing protein, partial [Fistulina hepatica ATCC 64428]
GLAALKTVLDSANFKNGTCRPVLFESRKNIGGIWHVYRPPLPAPHSVEPPATPLYDSLTTNLPHPVMAYTSYCFPPETPIFPKASHVQSYLESFTDHFKLWPYIRLDSRVDLVTREDERWKIRVNGELACTCEHLIVANGHYNVPRYPDAPGLDKWLAENKASHSAWYRRPGDFGDCVLVVGGGPSGSDITNELRKTTKRVIHASAENTPVTEGNVVRKGRVAAFKDNNVAFFEDGSTESGIDYCIVATGYEMAFPFLPEDVLKLDLATTLPSPLLNSTYHVFPLAEHIFPIQQDTFPPSSIAFLGLPIRVSPFPLLEAQAAAAVHVFTHPEALEIAHEADKIRLRGAALRTKIGNDPVLLADAWHRFEAHEQFDYRDALYKFSGVPVVAADWEKEMYDNKGTLRAFWVDIERRGEQEAWLKGVGVNGIQDWVDLLRRMLEAARSQKITLIEGYVDETASVVTA